MTLDFNKLFPIIAVVGVLVFGGWLYSDLSRVTSWLYPERVVAPPVQVVVVDPPVAPPIVAPVPHSPPIKTPPKSPRLTGFFVQLNSYRTAKEATQNLKIYDQYKDLFDTSKVRYYGSSLPNGYWYRVVVQVDSQAKAESICQTIKSRGGDCIALTIN